MLVAAFSLLTSLRFVSAHVSPFTPSMWGFNVTAHTFDFDNRPVVPLMHRTFDQWWMHGHLAYPPHPDDVFELPAGGTATLQIACDKGATTYFASSEGGDVQEPHNPNNVCPGATPKQYHTTGLSDVKGCALGIAYKSDISQVKPEDITIFSVNQTCVWSRYTDFSVPKQMPACPDGKCICTWHWIHSPDSGSEQMYMNGFQCNVTNSVSNVPLATPQVARRCGADPHFKKLNADPGNCTYGAKQPLYWFQKEGNNMFEGTYAPPFYSNLYNFRDGAQDDIFQDYYKTIPVPGVNQTELPIRNTLAAIVAPGNSGSSSTTSTVSSPTLPADMSSPSAVPTSGTGPKSQCRKKRSPRGLSGRHVSVERRTPFAHNVAGMTRRSRTLDPEKRLDLWNPL